MKFFIPSSLFFLCIFSTAIAQQLPIVKMPVFKKDTISIIQFGARADGSTLNTKSFTNAINRCNAKGGGVVLVPAGLWITGPFELKSNVNLHLPVSYTHLDVYKRQPVAIVLQIMDIWPGILWGV